MSKIGLNIETFRRRGRDMQGRYVRGAGGSNAIPGMMLPKFIGDTSGKIVHLADIYRLPIVAKELAAEDVDPGYGKISRPIEDFLKLAPGSR